MVQFARETPPDKDGIPDDLKVIAQFLAKQFGNLDHPEREWHAFLGPAVLLKADLVHRGRLEIVPAGEAK